MKKLIVLLLLIFSISAFGGRSSFDVINLKNQSTPSNLKDGDIFYYNTGDFLRYYNGTISRELTTNSGTQTLQNKSIDADANTITNIDNADIKAGAAIDAAKIHDGSVSNTEYGYLNGVTSAIQTQINSIAADTIVKGNITSTVAASGTPGNWIDLTNFSLTAGIVTGKRVYLSMYR